MKDDFSHNAEKDLREARQIASLIAGFIQQDLSEKEQDQLDEWVGASDENMKLFEELTDEKNIDRTLQWLDRLDTREALEKVKAKAGVDTAVSPPSFKRRWPYAAVSLIAILIIASLWYFLDTDNVRPSGTSAPVISSGDLAPGGKKAILLMGDGRRVRLSAFSDTLITLSGKTIAHNENSLLSYDGDISAHAAATFNTLLTPAGGEYQVRLPDGTMVWLNAASSLTYPTVFAGGNRTVELSGEAYFEVARNTKKPFIVKASTDSIEVLGTHFNVNAYAEDKRVRTSLLEGIVRVSRGVSSVQLARGQQAISDGKGIQILDKPQMEEVIAWKNGLFSFTADSIQTIMSQLARWYDIEVAYQADIPHLFTGRIYRSSTASQVFRLLEISGDVHFKIAGRKVIVTP